MDKAEGKYDIIVIGAGPAGIGAVVNLSKNNSSYIVLEARDRLGGRVYSKQIDGVLIDVGASWIHAYSETNPMKQYVDTYQIKCMRYLEKPARVIIDGQSKKQFDQTTINAAVQILQEMLKVAKQNAEKLGKDISIGQGAKDFIQKKIANLDPILKRCVEFFIQEAQLHEGSSINQLSVGYEYKIDEGANFLPACTYNELYSRIANDHKINVNFNKVVEKISYEKGKAGVWCRDGSFYAGKKIICSIPLGVLKTNSVKFVPELPKEHADSISKLGLGIGQKLIVSFQSNFWGELGPGTWVNIAFDSGNRLSQVIDFSKDGRHILCCFITGELRKKSPQEVLEEFLSFLSKVYDASKLKVRDYFMSSWTEDEFTRVAVTSFHVGSSEKESYQLRKPIEDTLWFVGEHCAAEFIGTAHGAFRTGKWASEQAIKSLTQPCQAQKS